MRRLVPLLLAPLLVLGGALPAQAEVSTGEVAVALQRSPVYQEPGVDLVDVPTLVAELPRDAPRVVVAVLASAPTDATAGALATAIGGGLLDTDVVVLVVTADQRYGAATGRAAALRGVDARAALEAERASIADAPFDRDTVTAFVASFAQRVAGQAATDRSVPQSDDEGLPLIPLALLAVLAAAGVLTVRWSRHRQARALDALRADVVALLHRLAEDVAGLQPGEDPVAAQAVADAAERYDTASALRSRATSAERLEAVRRTALEGLHAARVARAALGLKAGPPLPSLPVGDGPRLTEPGEVRVGERVFRGSPTYEPGRKHYFAGGGLDGRRVPAGWYSVAFWEPLLVGPLLAGGLGGHDVGGTGSDGCGDLGGADVGGGDVGAGLGDGGFGGGGDC